MESQGTSGFFRGSQGGAHPPSPVTAFRKFRGVKDKLFVLLKMFVNFCWHYFSLGGDNLIVIFCVIYLCLLFLRGVYIDIATLERGEYGEVPYLCEVT